MSKNHQFKKSAPLMYIANQKIQPAAVNVQQVYHIYKKQEEKQERVNEVLDEVAEEIAQKSNEVNENAPEEAGADTKKKEKQHPPVQKSIGKERNKKPFKKLNIKEKLNFLNSFPSFIPKPECEIITITSNYKGRVVALKDEKITIKLTGSEEDVVINSSEVLSINILTV
jgi:acetolactate synthase small subunit